MNNEEIKLLKSINKKLASIENNLSNIHSIGISNLLMFVFLTLTLLFFTVLNLTGLSSIILSPLNYITAIPPQPKELVVSITAGMILTLIYSKILSHQKSDKRNG
jgi:hypothetical protein